MLCFSCTIFCFDAWLFQGKQVNETDALGPRLTLFSHTAIVSADHLETRSIIQIISDHKIGSDLANYNLILSADIHIDV